MSYCAVLKPTWLCYLNSVVTGLITLVTLGLSLYFGSGFICGRRGHEMSLPKSLRAKATFALLLFQAAQLAAFIGATVQNAVAKEGDVDQDGTSNTNSVYFFLAAGASNLHPLALCCLFALFSSRAFKVFEGSVYAFSERPKRFIRIAIVLQVLFVLALDALAAVGEPQHVFLMHGSMLVFYLITYTMLFILFLKKLKQLEHSVKVAFNLRVRSHENSTGSGRTRENTNSAAHPSPGPPPGPAGPAGPALPAGGDATPKGNTSVVSNFSQESVDHTPEAIPVPMSKPRSMSTTHSSSKIAVSGHGGGSKADKHSKQILDAHIAIMAQWTVLVGIALFSTAATSMVSIGLSAAGLGYDAPAAVYGLTGQIFDDMVNVICLSLQFAHNADIYNVCCAKCHKLLKRMLLKK